MAKNFFFRVDANANIGRGHLSRCLAMADMLKTHFEISFVSLEENSRYFKQLDLKYPVHFIASENGIFNLISRDDLVCLDGYQFTESYKEELQSKVRKLIEINDIPYEAKHVDIIINHTPSISKEQFRETNAQLYLGLKYALLRKSFLDYAKQTSKLNSDTDGVFVCFGGADTFNLGKKFVDRLIQHDFNDPIYWVTHQNLDDIKNLNLPPNVRILSNLDEYQMIHYMEKAKVLVIPSSVLSLEAIALRKPFFTGYYVNNQKHIFEGLKKQSLAKCYGYLETGYQVDESLLSLLAFYKDIEKQQEMLEAQKSSIDGNSGFHISNILISLNKRQSSIKDTTLKPSNV